MSAREGVKTFLLIFGNFLLGLIVSALIFLNVVLSSPKLITQLSLLFFLQNFVLSIVLGICVVTIPINIYLLKLSKENGIREKEKKPLIEVKRSLYLFDIFDLVGFAAGGFSLFFILLVFYIEATVGEYHILSEPNIMVLVGEILATILLITLYIRAMMKITRARKVKNHNKNNHG